MLSNSGVRISTSSTNMYTIYFNKVEQLTKFIFWLHVPLNNVFVLNFNKCKAVNRTLKYPKGYHGYCTRYIKRRKTPVEGESQVLEGECF